MDDIVINQLFQPLWDDILEEDQFYVSKPLLAHYTSVQVLESMSRTNEVWFSNPLFMNDYNEVKFGMFQSIPLVSNSDEINQALGSPERMDVFNYCFKHYYDSFTNDEVVDTYILCLSEHDRNDTDGRLSMWRGYGHNGNGVAVVLDAAKLLAVGQSPFIIAKVSYATSEDIIIWTKDLIRKFVETLTNTHIPDDKLYLAAFNLFERIKLLSLFTKHHGFKEEKEWRIVYMKHRDANNFVSSMLSYWVGPRGVEPKLKLKVEPIEGLINDLSLPNIIDSIIIGPCAFSPLAEAAIMRMLNNLGQTELAEKIHISTIPFRG